MAENKEGVIEGWLPPEETDYDLRRRLQREKFQVGLAKKSAVSARPIPGHPKSHPTPSYPSEEGFNWDDVTPEQRAVNEAGLQVVREKLKVIKEKKS